MSKRKSPPERSNNWVAIVSFLAVILLGIAFARFGSDSTKLSGETNTKSKADISDRVRDPRATGSLSTVQVYIRGKSSHVSLKSFRSKLEAFRVKRGCAFVMIQTNRDTNCRPLPNCDILDTHVNETASSFTSNGGVIISVVDSNIGAAAGFGKRATLTNTPKWHNHLRVQLLQ